MARPKSHGSLTKSFSCPATEENKKILQDFEVEASKIGVKPSVLITRLIVQFVDEQKNAEGPRPDHSAVKMCNNIYHNLVNEPSRTLDQWIDWAREMKDPKVLREKLPKSRELYQLLDGKTRVVKRL